MSNERYPDAYVNMVMRLPTYLKTNATLAEVVKYLRELHGMLSLNQVNVARAVDVLAYHRTVVATEMDVGGANAVAQGGAPQQPDATGSGAVQFVVDRDSDQVRAFVDILNENGLPRWYEIGRNQYTGEPTGIEDADAVTLSFDDGTREVTVEPAGTEYFYLLQGVRRKVTTTESVVIPDTIGLHHVYFNSDGDLVSDTAVTIEDLLRNNVYVANVYWNGSTGVILGNELHGLMPWQTHYLIHSFFGGARHTGGLTLADIVEDASGDEDEHAEFSVASGGIIDEDLEHAISARAAGDTIITLARSGAAGTWIEAASIGAPVVLSGGVPQFNSYSGGVWGNSSVSNNSFFLGHLFATNDWRVSRKVVAIQGQNQYGTIGQAREGATEEIAALVTEGLPMAEFVPIATLIYQYSSGYGNAYKARIRSTDDGEPYINWLTEELGRGVAPSAHPNTTGRDLPSQHPDSAIDLSTAPAAILAGAVTVDDAMKILDNLSEADIPLTGTYTDELASATDLEDAMHVLDDLNDSRVDLKTAHAGLLSGQSTVDDAMNILDDLVGSDIDIDDEDVDVTGAYGSGGLLNGDTTLDQALDTINAITTEFTTRQQIMGGSVAAFDNTVTTIVTFTLPTGPSSIAVGMTFVGTSNSATNACKVIIQGWLMATRNSSGTVTAEWVETFNDNKSSGIAVTFGTCEVTVTVSSADVLVKIKLDTNLDQNWGVKWTALMSDDVTVVQG
jgi:hypothetical protein